jgi:hypothetical protein
MSQIVNQTYSYLTASSVFLEVAFQRTTNPAIPGEAAVFLFFLCFPDANKSFFLTLNFFSVFQYYNTSF